MSACSKFIQNGPEIDIDLNQDSSDSSPPYLGKVGNEKWPLSRCLDWFMRQYCLNFLSHIVSSVVLKPGGGAML